MKLSDKQLSDYEQQLLEERDHAILEIERFYKKQLYATNNQFMLNTKLPNFSIDFDNILENTIQKLRTEIEQFYQECNNALWAVKAKMLLNGELSDYFIHFEHNISDTAIQKICNELLKKYIDRITVKNYVKDVLFKF